jgi:hypothetical protein
MLPVRYAALIFLYFTAFLSAFAQLSPPGLEETRAVAWAAIGVTQQTGARWQTTVYLGGSRESKSDNFSLFKRFAIGVLDFNELYRINDHWSVAAAVSFRKQGMYDDELKEEDLRNEIRYYARLYYRHKINRISFAYSFRPEFRTYYASTSVPYTYRFRLKAQASIPLDQSGSNQFVLGDEILALAQPKFENYAYSEDRLTTYFRHTFKKPALIFDVGFMYQFLASEGLITHFAVDLIFLDPFMRHSSEK